MIGYTCKYAPLEIIESFDENAVCINDEAENFDCAHELTHMNMCGNVKALLEQIEKENIKELVIINCCDGNRRAFDILEDKLDFIYLIDLPHVNNGCSVEQLADELIGFIRAYENYLGRSFSNEHFIETWKEMSDIHDSDEADNSSDYIGIFGACVGNGLRKQLKDLVPMEIRDFTCCEIRHVDMPLSDEYASADRSLSNEINLKALMNIYAKALLSQIPCLRMADIAQRRAMFNVPHLKGVIYHTVKFCDYYAFEAMAVRNKIDVPMMMLETDFTMQSEGQLRTRIDAFTESLGLKEMHSVNSNGKYYVGIDSGSTTTNIAVIDSDGKLVDSSTVRTGPKASSGAEKAIHSLTKVNPDEIALTFATGYGRQNLGMADDSITEITCHARGARYLMPDVNTIIDIGGQDSKAIHLDEEGDVKSFAMNDKCAAGTGRFMENMAKVLELDMDEMGDIGLDWDENITISSMCTVFAESEVVSLIADNEAIADIVHGLDVSVASKTMQLVHRVQGEAPYIMTGGGARNRGIVKCLEEKLGSEITVPENPDLCGAIGAALFARDAAE